MDRGNLAGYSLWSHKESDMTEHTQLDLGDFPSGSKVKNLPAMQET